jgi:NitT/TauT family transport system substrate-binding protein
MDSIPAMKGHGLRRRRFLAGASAVGAASLIAFPPSASAEPPPEVKKLTLFEVPITCAAPHYVAEELLYAEGFTDVRFLKWPTDTKNWGPQVLLSGEVEISLVFIPSGIVSIDAGAPLVVLGGSHIGCVELFGGPRVRSTRDLKGKTVAIALYGSDEQTFISMFAAYVGVNPTDINWVVHPDGDYERLLVEDKVDAFMTGPPYSQALREKKIGHVLVDTTTDKPWSQYLCCAIASTREFVGKYPVATKRALRAFLKAADICGAQPQLAARLMADRGLSSYEHGFQMLRSIPYGKWRDFDTEDALRFFALRMQEVGVVKSSPQKIIAQGTDWRFFNQLRRELKA